MSEPNTPPLRRGWTTGACPSEAARAAFEADELHAHFARAGIVKDAGDDRDVTHGACHRERKRSDSEMKGRGGDFWIAASPRVPKARGSSR